MSMKKLRYVKYVVMSHLSCLCLSFFAGHLFIIHDCEVCKEKEMLLIFVCWLLDVSCGCHNFLLSVFQPRKKHHVIILSDV